MINNNNPKINNYASSKAAFVVAPSDQQPKTRNVFLLFVFFFSLSITSCKKLVDVHSPTTSISSENVYSADATAIAALTNVYTIMSSINYGSSASIPTISFWAGLSADEFKLYSTPSNQQLTYYSNSLAPDIIGTAFWQNAYTLIYPCNAAIEGLNSSGSLSPLVKQQLLGEAKFLRAFFYFYLVNLYGDVPLVLSTDYTVNSTISRTSKSQVYEQIVSDLKAAQALLSDQYLNGQLAPYPTNTPSSVPERVRPTKWAATSLLSRVYLYSNNFSNAEMEASKLIDNSSLFALNTISNVFLANHLSVLNKEAIWQLQPVTTGTITNTAEAVFFDLSLAPVGVNSSHPVSLSPALIASFESGDQRVINGNWVKTYTNNGPPITTLYYPYKYKVSAANAAVTEYTMLLRLAEQYLIRAEARTQQGNISGAQNDLNAIRSRAGLPNTTASTQATLLAAIMHERQVELFTELGQRWFDLKRSGTIDAVMGVGGACAAKGGIWVTTQQLYPISTGEMQKDPNLIQTPGY